MEPRLSVVIPALDAAAHVSATLRSVAEADEVVLVDGGSRDATRAIAAAFGARIVDSPRGRGRQLALGIEAAREDWLLLLHADTSLAAGWHPAASAHMARHPGTAGYFRLALDSPAWQARRLERWVAWRCRRLALPYGDQALLIERSLLRAVGGLRPLPIMEDVDLARRLGRSRLRPLEIAAITSARRWEAEGWRRRSARNLCCLALYFAGVPAGWIRRLYERG